MTEFRGERGDSGQRGIAGERGPKGDHGQHGEIGPQGPPGTPWKWRGLPVFRTLAFALVVLAAMGAVYEVSQNGIDDVQHAELASCIRVQYLRDQANGSSFLIYETFRQALKSQEQAAEKYTTAEARRQARLGVERAQKVVDTTVVTGPTDCHQAVFNEAYKPPTPEFIRTESARVQAARASAAKIIVQAEKNQPVQTP